MKIFGQQYSLSEVAETLIKGAATIVPIAGSLASVYGDWQNKNQIANVIDILTKHEESLKILEDKINNIYIESELYLCDTIQTILKGQNEIIEPKRMLYATYLTACCLSTNENCKIKGELLDIVSRINNVHLTILDHLESGKPHTNKFNNVFHITSGVNRDGSKLEQNEVETHLEYLISLGLVIKIDIKGIGSVLSTIGFKKDIPHFIGTKDIFYRSNLGNELIRFLLTK